MIAAFCHKKHLHLSLGIGLAAFVALFVLASSSFGQEAPGGPTETEVYNREKAIQIASESGGPGGCDSAASCDAFCNTPTNQKTCMDWALANGVISQSNYDKYSGFTAEGGPGGCKTPETCKSYCENESNFDECLEFGQKQGLVSEEQVRRARKTGPGGCRTKKDCQTFCENPQNQDVCIDHAVTEGFMSSEEAQRIKEFRTRADEFRRKAEGFRKQAGEFKRPGVEEIDPGFDEDKARQILAAQGGPGGCKTFDECEDFCENPDNQLTCFEFAEKNNLFANRKHAEKIKRIVQEGGPGGCRGEKTCRQFCDNEANFDVCLQFAEKHDLITPEELQKAKRGLEAIREGGPTGCRSKDECERVCEDPANQEACFEWAIKHDLISKEEAKFIEEAKKMREKFESRRHEFENRPPEGFKHPEGFRPPEGFHPPGEFLGPGGCVGADECRKYCSLPEHAKECEGFRTPSGIQPPGFGGDRPTSEFRPELSPQHEEFKPPEEFKQETLTDPSVECAQHGGSWTGTNCVFPEPSQPPPQPIEQTPQIQHEQTPYFSPPPLETEQPQSLRNNKYLGAIIRFLLGNY